MPLDLLTADVLPRAAFRSTTAVHLCEHLLLKGGGQSAIDLMALKQGCVLCARCDPRGIVITRSGGDMDLPAALNHRLKCLETSAETSARLTVECNLIEQEIRSTDNAFARALAAQLGQPWDPPVGHLEELSVLRSAEFSDLSCQIRAAIAGIEPLGRRRATELKVVRRDDAIVLATGNEDLIVSLMLYRFVDEVCHTDLSDMLRGGRQYDMFWHSTAIGSLVAMICHPVTHSLENFTRALADDLRANSDTMASIWARLLDIGVWPTPSGAGLIEDLSLHLSKASLERITPSDIGVITAELAEQLEGTLS